MEIQPLFYSTLNTDCIYKFYDKIVYNRRLPYEMDQSIQLYSYFVMIIENVQHEYELYKYENDMLWILNDNIALCDGISSDLNKEHPYIDVDFFKFKLLALNTKSCMFKIWCLMNINKKQTFLELMKYEGLLECIPRAFIPI